MKNVFLCLAVLCSARLAAQQAFAKLVVGLEVGRDLQQYSGLDRPVFIPHLHVEYPWRNFSVGLGLAHKNAPLFQYDAYTGDSQAGLLGEKKVVFHQVASRQFRPDYWSVPLRVIYRFTPCRCIYADAGLAFDFLNTRRPETTLDTYTVIGPKPPQQQRAELFKASRRSYEVGLGFKLHSSDYFRLVLRPSYVWTENPERGAETAFLRSLRLSFGAQYAFVRYGGRK